MPNDTGRASPSMRETIERFAWEETPLGPMRDWPRPLMAVVEMMLASRFAMVIAWGPDLRMIYNDAYAPFLGARHPAALGQPMADVWYEIWPDIHPLVEDALAGRPVFHEELFLQMTRNGFPEDTWWNFSYSPVVDESGRIAGIIDVAVEMTGKVMNERALASERDKLRESEARLAALVGATSDVIYQMSADWQEMRQLEGRGLLVDTDRPSIRWIEEYLPDEDVEELQAAIAQAIRDKAPFQLEHRVRQADGQIGWVQSRAVPILDADGVIQEWFGTASDVTGAHQAREALATSRDKLELATRAARLGQFDYLPELERLEWDDRCRELFGLPPGAPVGYESAFVAGLHPDDRKRAIAAVEAALAPGGAANFDTEYRTVGLTDGVERYVHAQGFAIFDGNRPVRLIGTVQDVTADRSAQAALKETEERLRLAGRATNDAVWDWDLVRDRVLWNEALETAYGHPLATVGTSGSWWIEQIHPDDRARIDASIHAVIDGTGSDWTDDYRFARADGGYIDVRDRGYVIRDESGAAIRMIGAMLDQTDRKEAERALERAKAGLEEAVAERTRERDQIWQATPDLLGVATLDGFFKELNPAWQVTLGWSDAELKDAPYLDFVHPDDVEATQLRMAALARGEGVFGFENRYARKDGGHVWLSWNAIPQNRLVYAVVRDVSAAHAQADALARAQEQLRQSQKMEAVGQLTGGIAHDFNNMLTGVMGSLELLQLAIAHGRHDRIERYIDAATTSAQRAAALTQRLLAFSRRQTLDVQSVDVNRVVTGMEDLLHRTLGEGIPPTLTLKSDLWHAMTDANQLESALLNLAINARDAMTGGGALSITTDNIAVGETQANGFDELEPGDYVLVSVTDTGTGMSADVVAKAFDPFFTTKPIGQGTGLGLSMIYGFTRQTGGHARIRSEPGEGTTVQLFLRRATTAPGEAAAAEALSLGSGNGECVMVVEDDPAVRMLIVEVLENLGYDVIDASDGRAAVDLLAKRPPIRLLVTDVGLPGVNGREVASFARRQLPDLKVLFVTGYIEQARIRSDFLDAGMDMITKPFAINVLSDKVVSMIGD